MTWPPTWHDDKDWSFHDCPRCVSLFEGGLLRRNQVSGSERPVIVLFQTQKFGTYSLLFADLNQLPFEADDGASECGGTLPVPWAWEDANPVLLEVIRGKSRFRS